MCDAKVYRVYHAEVGPLLAGDLALCGLVITWLAKKPGLEPGGTTATRHIYGVENPLLRVVEYVKFKGVEWSICEERFVPCYR
jgi:hypothetical protein